jgi:ureidoacrylate peracid hydrolase
MPRLKPEWVAPKRTALLLVDCQVDFGASEGEMARRGADIGPAQAALERARALLEAARAAHVRVVFVRLVSKPAEETPRAREARARHHDDKPPVCLEGTPGAEFTGVHPALGEAVVTKPLFSAFFNTGLDQVLHAGGLDTLVLAGLTTECCVASTAWDAFERDFHIFIAEDACAAYEPDLHAGALEALKLSGAFLAPAADYAAAWK